MDTLIKYSNVITALATIALVYITYVLAKVTEQLFVEQRRLSEPNVVVSMEPNPRHHMIVNVTIENVGGGLAKNIQVEMLDELKSGDRSLKNLSFYTQYCLKPKTAVTSAVSSYFELGENKKTRFKVTYEGGAGKKYSEVFDIDLTVFEGILTIGEKTIDDVVKPLERIAKNFESISSNRRLGVDIYNSAERLEEQKKWDQRYAQKRAEKIDEDAE